jgi:hypothetical protein
MKRTPDDTIENIALLCKILCENKKSSETDLDHAFTLVQKLILSQPTITSSYHAMYAGYFLL